MVQVCGRKLKDSHLLLSAAHAGLWAQAVSECFDFVGGLRDGSVARSPCPPFRCSPDLEVRSCALDSRRIPSPCRLKDYPQRIFGNITENPKLCQDAAEMIGRRGRVVASRAALL